MPAKKLQTDALDTAILAAYHALAANGSAPLVSAIARKVGRVYGTVRSRILRMVDAGVWPGGVTSRPVSAHDPDPVVLRVSPFDAPKRGEDCTAAVRGMVRDWKAREKKRRKAS